MILPWLLLSLIVISGSFLQVYCSAWRYRNVKHRGAAADKVGEENKLK